jgi:hypothetical protein
VVPEPLARDFERFGRALPADFPAYVRERYRIDLSARYLGVPLPHPIGKGSGQLSLNLDQLETDRAAGLAFAVLKTVIAEDPSGARTMGAWAIHETRMKVEPIRSPSGRSGWTVTWKGRGWDRPFEDYLALVRGAGELTRSGFLAIPSAKFHLPLLDQPFRAAEYRHTTTALARAWGEPVLALEKDFSPTLAGDPLADERARVLRWLAEVPREVRAASGPTPVRLALKQMNARNDDAFQLAMLDAAGEADALVCFNRLWSAERGLAYGGPELGERNLRVLAMAAGRPRPALAGTGDICSGRRVLEYARCGCESVQLHTCFQLPLSEYPASGGSRTSRALHALVFHPERGMIAGLLELEQQALLHRHDGELRFLDLVPAPAPATGADAR